MWTEPHVVLVRRHNITHKCLHTSCNLGSARLDRLGFCHRHASVFRQRQSESADKMTSVDCQDRPGHVGGGVRREQKEWTIEIFETAQSPLRYASDHRAAGMPLPQVA